MIVCSQLEVLIVTSPQYGTCVAIPPNISAVTVTTSLLMHDLWHCSLCLYLVCYIKCTYSEVSISIYVLATLLHKYVNVDVDPHNKSDRPEWATARYHAYYSPSCAFEFQVQWMVATGQILGDLVSCLYI